MDETVEGKNKKRMAMIMVVFRECFWVQSPFSYDLGYIVKYLQLITSSKIKFMLDTTTVIMTIYITEM